MQQEILEFVYGRLYAFKSSSIKADLAERLVEGNEEQYQGRFFKPEWAGVLGIVRRYMQADFQPKWATCKEDNLPEDGQDVEEAFKAGFASAVLQFARSKTKGIDHDALQREALNRAFEDKLGR